MHRLRTIATGIACLVIGFLSGFVVNDVLRISVISYIINFISTLNAEMIAAVAGSLAFIVATLTLWYSTLKSPDIRICEEPEFLLKEISKDTFDHHILDRFWFNPTGLVFANYGPRAGAFRPEIKFSCSKELEPFFKMYTCHFKIGDAQLEKTMYAPIRDKECLIVKVDLYVDFCDWKKSFDSKLVEQDGIKDVLCQADQENKQRFSKFCSILKPGMYIGRIDIRARQTTRNKIFGTEMRERDHFVGLDRGLINEELIGNFQSCLKRWDDIEPSYILDEVREIAKDLDNLHAPLYSNFRRLMGAEELTSLNYDLLRSWKGKYEGYETKRAIADFLIRRTKLDVDFSKYEPDVSKVNRMIEVNREFLSPEVSADIKKIGDPLKKKTSDLIEKVQKLQGILNSCIKSNV